LSDTIEIRLPQSDVEANGGDIAWRQALGFANVEAVNRGWTRMPSQRYDDCTITFDDGTREYVFVFGLPIIVDFRLGAYSGYTPVIAF
jgi:hypothetical protein